MSGGWFAMSRAMFQHPLFADKPLHVAAWAWMLATAAWKDTRQDASGKTVTVKRGQLLTSYRQMSKATGVSVQTLRTLIKRLTDENALEYETNTGRLLITICNYDKYQSALKSPNTASTQHQHSINTQKNNGTIEQGSVSIETEAEASVEPVQVSVLSKAVWDCKPFLASKGVKNPGGVIGRWLKTSKPVAILEAIEAAQKSGTEDPVPYITEALKGVHNGQRTSNAADRRLEARLAGARAFIEGKR